jgi:DNA (cytosine-5)-methyltransferase 1
LKYLSVCSGIEAASVAWKGLEWEAAGFSEIEPFPCAVLNHHFPTVTNFGDLTKHEQWKIQPGTIDVICGGTPCQSFSVAGLRAGMADPRGNLALTFLSLCDRIRPEWIVWENVPGVLSSNGGRDFGAFLGALAQLGYGFAYRILDAQYFGVAQRRRRVFVVANARDWRRAAAVLFEPESLRGDSAPRRAKGQGITAGPRRSVDTIGTLCADSHPGSYAGQDAYTGRLIPARLGTIPIQDGRGLDKGQNGLGIGEAGDPSYTLTTMGAASVAAPLAAIPINGMTINKELRDRQMTGIGEAGDPMFTIRAEGGQHAVATPEPIAFHPTQDPISSVGISHTIGTGTSGGAATCAVVTPAPLAVRRLTPRECERLQGFPDDWTAIPFRGKPAADGPRYKAIGNSMAVPVMKWIGERIAIVDAATKGEG